MFSRKRALSLLCAACMAASLLCMAKPIPTYASNLSDQLQEVRDASRRSWKSRSRPFSPIRARLWRKRPCWIGRMISSARRSASCSSSPMRTQTRITELTQKEQEQYELFCRQVREEEERGTVSYWSVLFKASSFTDLLARMDFVNEVMDYDRQVISDLQTTRRQLTEDKAALEQQKSEMESSQTKLQQQVDAASTLIREYEETEAGHQAMLDEAAEDELRIQELIRQQQSGGSSGGGGGSGSNSGVDGYIWPTNNTRVVTSPYGERWCPFHGYESHNGADIDAARGSAVLAAKSGRVIQAGWNGGYGISVMIAHDDGITTLYGHMDGCSVSVGQTVSQGETIGICGNTGNSSGAHIHYTMYKNGGTIDPLPYLPGYIAWDW
ncbi:MAG: murein hydrolase activator EnvC family protein [Oscillospiraceae bacterium]